MRTILTSLLLPLLFAIGPAHAGQLDELIGTWELVPEARGAEQLEVERERVVQASAALLRPIIRSKLQVVARASDVIRIEQDGDLIVITDDTGTAWPSDLEGTPFKGRSADGGRVTYARRWEDGGISAEGNATFGLSTFRFAPQGEHLQVSIEMSSPFLGDDLSYSLLYRRIEG